MVSEIPDSLGLYFQILDHQITQEVFKGEDNCQEDF